jgi:hypothetical protein
MSTFFECHFVSIQINEYTNLFQINQTYIYEIKQISKHIEIKVINLSKDHGYLVLQ